jgi:hypothetical protein
MIEKPCSKSSKAFSLFQGRFTQLTPDLRRYKQEDNYFIPKK